MNKLIAQGSNLTVDSRQPVRAERDVADYFRQEVAEAEAEAEASASGSGFLSRLFGRLRPAASDEADATGAARPRKKVLLVDDHPDSVEALVGMFTKLGYEATCVTSAAEALSAIRAQRPAVVLVDIMMPGMDGVDLLRAIRANPETAKVPVVMLTADARRCLDAFTSGAQDYLLKPVDFPKVRESVERQLGVG